MASDKASKINQPMRLFRLRYCIAPAVIYLAINTGSWAANQTHTNTGSSIKLRGQVDIILSAFSSAGITVSSDKLPAKIEKIRLGSPALYANIAAGDKILSAQLNNNKLSLLIERVGKKFSAQLSTVPVNLQINDNSEPSIANKDSQPEVVLMKASADRLALQGNAACNKLADAWIRQYDDPDNKQLQSEIDLLQREIQLQVESHGGQWHIAAYYRDGHKDPKFLLCEGVRFYAVGDLDNAKRLFEEVAKRYPDNGDVYYNLGALCESKSEFALAASYYKQALSHKPFDLEIKKAASSVGQVPLIYQGGIFHLATPMSELKATHMEITDTCNLCKILRNGVMHGG